MTLLSCARRFTLASTFVLGLGAIGTRPVCALPAAGLTNTGDLIRFDTDAPTTLISGPTPITGVASGEGLVGIDVRPANGQLYALAKSSPGQGRIYTINIATGVATPGPILTANPTDTTDPYTGLSSGAEFGIDFNPVVDRLRVVSDADQNLRINVDDGTVITDTNLAYASGDTNEARNPVVTAAAYTNSVAGAATTTLYDIDLVNRIISIQNPPNNGTLNTVGSGLPSDPISTAGFDIDPASNEGFITLTSNSLPTTSYLYSVNVTSGNTSLVERIGGVARVSGFALLPAANATTDVAPTLDTLTLTPNAPGSDDLLTATATASDADAAAGQTLTYTFNWTRTRAGETVVLKTTSNTTGTDTLDTSGDSVVRGDIIIVSATVSDGTLPSAAKSASVTIVNSAPSVKVTVTPTTPNTNDLLTANVEVTDADSDTLTTSYQWKKNGANFDGQTGATLDLSQAGIGDKGDTFSVVVTVSDGSVSTSSESNTVTVSNSAPTISGVDLQPTGPKTDDPLMATVTPASDIDGDSVTYTFTWTVLRKGQTRVVKTTKNTTNLTDMLQTLGAVVIVGDVVTVSVVANDGTANSAPRTASVTIGNSPVVMKSIVIKSATPNTLSLLTADVSSSDPDGGRPTYTFTWTRIRGGQATVVQTSTGTSSQNKLDLSKAGYGDKGDTISLTVTANDGASTDSLTKTVTVINTVPTVTSVSLSPAPTRTSTVTASVAGSDPDATDGIDTLSYTYKWRINNGFLSGQTTNTLDLSKYPNVKAGDVVSVEVRATDGQALSVAKTAKVTVGGAVNSPTKGFSGGNS